MKCNASLLLNGCDSAVISNVSISIKAGYTGLFAVNVKNSSTITNLKVYVDCSRCPEFYSRISGVIFYYFTSLNNTSTKTSKQNSVINLFHYQYKTYGSCPYLFQYAITLLPFQKHHNMSFNIHNTTFTNLENSSLLYYCAEISEIDVMCTVIIKDCLICNNMGNNQLTMLHIELSNYREIIKDISFYHYDQQQNKIYFENCTFINNANIKAMIYITPGSSRMISGYIALKKVVFSNNRQLHFIKVKSTTEIIWQYTTYIKLTNVEIISNKHTEGDSLISVTNAVIYFSNSIKFNNNSYYRYILELYFSIVVCKGFIQLTNNMARQILQAKSGSYVII